MELENPVSIPIFSFIFRQKKEDSALSQSLLYLVVSLFDSLAFSRYPVLSFFEENWMRRFEP